MSNGIRTMTLTDFLLARIAEDEEIARAACHQKIAGPSFGSWGSDSALLMANGALDRLDRQHVARHDPARVLAECEVKRRIVEHCEPEIMAKSPGDPYVLELLALPYADHPEYDEEWRP